jgi:hypothetical protein
MQNLETGSSLLDALCAKTISPSVLPESSNRAAGLAMDILEEEFSLSVDGERLPLCMGIVLFSAGLGPADAERAARLASGMEVLWRSVMAQKHAAEHADLLSNILVADYALARVFDTFIADGDREVMMSIAQGATALAEGVLAESASCADVEGTARGMSEYFEACFRVGARVAGIPDPPLSELGKIVRVAGMALCLGTPLSLPQKQLQEDSLDAKLLEKVLELSRILTGARSCV